MIYTNERLVTIYKNGLPVNLCKSEEKPTNFIIILYIYMYNEITTAFYIYIKIAL